MQATITARKSARGRPDGPSPATAFEVGMILDVDLLDAIIAGRQERGADLRDEVWDGVYMLMPLADDQHQELVTGFIVAFEAVAGRATGGKVRPGVNISDQRDDWTKNYRDPDVAVFLAGTTAENRETHWLGGPDFAVEIISKGDRAREKLDFYASVNVRELLIVDRFPWSLDLYRLRDGAYVMVGRSTIEDRAELRSEVLPVAFRLVPGADRPEVEILGPEGDRRWSV